MRPPLPAARDPRPSSTFTFLPLVPLPRSGCPSRRRDPEFREDVLREGAEEVSGSPDQRVRHPGQARAQAHPGSAAERARGSNLEVLWLWSDSA